jgi:hypothetical protein
MAHEEKPQGLKPRCNKAFSARLKSCPDTKQEFFRSRKTKQETCGTRSTSLRAGSESRALI